MKRWCVVVFALLTLLLSMSSVQADFETVLDNYVAYNHEFTNGDDMYSFFAPDAYRGDNSRNQLLIIKNGKSFIVNYDDCTTGLTYSYCYRNTTYDSNLIETGESNKVQPAIYVLIKEKVVETTLESKKTYSKTTVNLEEIITINLSLSITDEQRYSTINIKETIPDGFEIEDKGDFAITGKTLSKTISLDNDTKKWETVFSIKAVEEGTYQFQTKVDYNNEDSNGLVYASEEENITILGKYQFNDFISAKIARDSAAKYTMEIVNNHNESMNISQFSITTPGLPISEFTSVARENHNTFTASGTIAAGDSVPIEISMDAIFPGTHEVSYSALGYIGDEVFSETGSISFEVDYDDIACYFRTTNAEPQKGDEITVSAYIGNQGATIEDITGNLTGPIKTTSFDENKILFGIEKEVDSQTFVFRNDNEEATFTIDVAYIQKPFDAGNCTTNYTFVVGEPIEIVDETISETVDDNTEEDETDNTLGVFGSDDEADEEVIEENTEENSEESPSIVQKSEVEEEPQGFFNKLFALVKDLF